MKRFPHNLLVALTAAGLLAGHVGAATIQLAGTNVASGASVAVPVTVSSTTAALGGYTVTVTFNTNVVQFVNVSGGNGQFAAAPSIVATNTPGRVRIVHQQTASLTAPTGTVVVSKINFTAIGTSGSSSTVKLSDATADSTAGQSLAITGLTGATVQVGTPSQLQVTLSNSDFGTIATGTTQQVSCIVSNAGSGNLVGSASVAAPFGIVSGSPFNLVGGAATTVIVRFTPTAAASYNANLVISSIIGNSTNAVTGIGAIAPVTNFTGNPTSGAVSLPVTFTDTSSGTITSRTWDFGDGTTTNTTATNVSHTYAQVGTYSVSLTVAGPLGSSPLTRVNYITVTDGIDSTPPALAITAPSDYQTGSNALLTISGTASDASGVKTVTVNGQTASLNGNDWSTVVTLVAGTNTFTVIATDNSFALNTATQTVHAVLADAPVTGLQIVFGPVVTNALAQIGNLAVIVAGEPAVFFAHAVDPDGQELNYHWNFGDNETADGALIAHTYTASNCQAYAVNVAVDAGSSSVTGALTVATACALDLSQLKVAANFTTANRDQCSLAGLIDLGVGFAPTNTPLVVDVAGAQVGFTLDNKGRGISTNGTCRLSLDKRTGLWKVKIKLKGGDWQTSWGTAGMMDADAPVKTTLDLPVVLVVNTDAFASIPTVNYSVAPHRTGTAVKPVVK